MRCAFALCAVAVVTVTREAPADQTVDARVQRSAVYAAPVAFLASAHAVAAPRDISESLWLVGWSSLQLPFWSAQDAGSMSWGLAALVVGSGTELGGSLCRGDCREAIWVGGLVSYSAIAAADVGLSPSPNAMGDGQPTGGPASRRWYGWRPLIGYSSLLGGMWLGTVDEAGAAGAGFVLTGVGLQGIPLGHFGVARYSQGWVALGGMLLGAGVGALAACANGCESVYSHGTRAIFQPGRALVGASAGIATWAALDVAFLSFREQRDASHDGSIVTPYLTTSPTTGRPRAGVSLSF
jgi:hypothetical protein